MKVLHWVGLFFLLVGVVSYAKSLPQAEPSVPARLLAGAIASLSSSQSPAKVAPPLEVGFRRKTKENAQTEAIAYYRLKRLPADEKEIPVERYQTAQEQMAKMRKYSTAQQRYGPARTAREAHDTDAATEGLGTWTALGPGNIGGRTRALLIHPATPNVMYAAGVAGGVWKTTNSGARWEPLTDMMANLAVTCLAFDPSHPNTIYAGTGEGFFNSDAVRGAGIFRTTDGGLTWSQLASTATSDFFYVNDVVVSTAHPQHLYAGTRTGVWRSLNGGTHWEKVLDYVDGCLDLVLRTDQMTDYVFAACGSLGGGEIFRNTDAGGAGTWTSVKKETGMGRTSLAIAPANQNVVYAVAASNTFGTFRYGLHAVFRSMNGGEAGSWTAQVRNDNATKLNTILFSHPLSAFSAECGLGASAFLNQGWFDNVIAIDPLDANRVWVGGIDLFRSDDGGVNWGLASYSWLNKSHQQYVHADQHAIVFPPGYNGISNKQMLVGNSGGIFRTEDARAQVAMGSSAVCDPAASSVRWASLNNNYGVTQFYHGAVFPDGKSYLGGTQDNGTLLGTDSNGVNGWRELYGGTGGYVAIDATNPNVLYASSPGGRFRKSTDGGATFGDAWLGISDATLFIAPLAIDASDPQRLWAGGTKLWRSLNGAASWQPSISVASGAISAIAVAPSDANFVVAGTSTGRIYYADGALADSGWLSAQPRAGFVSGVTFEPVNRLVLYATYSTFGGQHVWRSNDGGASWTAIDGFGENRLPDIPVHCLVVDPNSSARLFVGTDLGVFVSLDGGATWAVENTGSANAPVEALVLATNAGATDLYAFTHGRGVWRVTIGNAACTYSLTDASRTVSPEGGTGQFSVTTSNGCSGYANSNASWITITTNERTVSYSVAPNPSITMRVGTITIANKSFTVIQTGIIDKTPPQVLVKTPTEANFYTTTADSINLSGLVTDNDLVVRVDWRVNRSVRNYPSLVGSTSWTLNNLLLEPGMNEITLTAQDRSGNLGSTTLTVFRTDTKSLLKVAGNGRYSFDGDYKPALIAGMAPAMFTHDAQGNIYLVDEANFSIRKIDAKTGFITTVAGNGSRFPFVDGGSATASGLDDPRAIAFDKNNNLYISEFMGHRIRKVTPAGMISTVVGSTAGFSGDGGLAINAKLNGPHAILTDADDNLYIADAGNRRIRKVNAQDQMISTIVGNGTQGFEGDGGLGLNAQLNFVMGLAFDSQGNLYLSDRDNHSVRKVTKTTGIISRVVGLAKGDFISSPGIKLATETGIREPYGIALDKQDNLYVVGAAYGLLGKVEAATGLMTTIAGGGTYQALTGLSPTTIRYDGMAGVSIDAAGNPMFCANHGNFTIYKILPAPAVDVTPPTLTITTPTNTTNYTTNSALVEVYGTVADNIRPTHITVKDERGKVDGYIFLGTGNENWNTRLPLQLGSNVFTFTAWDIAGNAKAVTFVATYALPTPSTILATIAGNRVAGFNVDTGSGLAAQLYSPEGIVVDNAGNLYVADKGNHRIRKITRAGLISTIAGNGQLGSSGDGGLAVNASLNGPSGVAVDAVGNVYFSDTNNHRIRKVDTAGILTTVAGTGVRGYGGDGGTARQAQLNLPGGIALDKNGNLLIADTGNHRVRYVNLSTGIITTVAGNGYGAGGDGGPAIQAQLNAPVSVAADSAGNFYLTDTGNFQVRKVSSTGIISRFAGTGTKGYSGDSGPAHNAQFFDPKGITVDAAGNVYITDYYRLRKVTPDGTVTTVVGPGNLPNDEGGTAFDARLIAAAGVAVDSSGNYFLADTGNHRIIRIANYQAATTVNGASFATPQVVAPEAIVSVFGASLATRDQAVTQLPLPTELAGTSVKVRDRLGVERLAPLFYVGKLQVNYQIPVGTAVGYATVSITNGNGEISTSVVNVKSVTPGIFTANQNGSGAAAGSVLYVTGGTRHSDSTAVCDANGQNCIPRQVDVNAASEVYLELYGTGLRNHSGLANVSVTVGGIAVPVLYAGKQPEFIGLDQINVPLPRSLAGRGVVDVVIVTDGKAANPVKIHLK